MGPKAKPTAAKPKPAPKRMASTGRRRAAAEEEARRKEIEDLQAELAAKEKQLQQKQKEMQAEEKRFKQREEETMKKLQDMQAREADLQGRERSVQQWQLERDEEWVAQQQGGVELLTRKDRYAILVAINNYKDTRIRDLHHSIEIVRDVGVLLEQLNFRCEYLHDDLPDESLPTRQNIVRAITNAKQVDGILVVYFVGYCVHGALTPPRTSDILRFVLPSDTPLEFAADTILSIDDMYTLMVEGTADINDVPFNRKGLLLWDGAYMGATHSAMSTGFAFAKATNGAEFGVEYPRNKRILLSLALQHGLSGSVNISGQIPVSGLMEYLQHKLVQKRELKCFAHLPGDPTRDFPLANKLLRAKHQIEEAKQVSRNTRCTFILTYTVNQDLDVHNALLVRIVSEKLIDFCGHGVEVGKMELVGHTDIILEGSIMHAVKPEKGRLWREAIDRLTGTVNIPYKLLSGESTRQGEEDVRAVVLQVETENEEVVNTMRNNFGVMTHFFGHPCIDLRQHFRVTLIGTLRQYVRFNKVARRGGLDDAIFTFTGLHKALYKSERFNNVDDSKMEKLVEEGVALLIVATDKSREITKRNQAVGRVADLEAFEGRIRFFFHDVLPEQPLPRVDLLPGPDISNHLFTNSVVLLDIRQARSYALLPGKSFFQGGFFPDTDLRMFCEDFLDGKLDPLNHRQAGANSHPRYRLL